MIEAIGFLLQKFRQCKAVEASIKSGKKLDDLVKMDGKKVVSTSVKLPRQRQELGWRFPARAGLGCLRGIDGEEASRRFERR